MTSSLQDIIVLCDKNNIELIGIKYPLSNEYLSAMNNKSFYADKLFKLNNLRVIDLKNIFSNNDNYFYDQDHLNERGSKEFMKVLSKELKK